MPDFLSGVASASSGVRDLASLAVSAKRALNSENDDCSEEKISENISDAQQKSLDSLKKGVEETLSKEGLSDIINSVQETSKAIGAGILNSANSVASQYADSVITDVILGKGLGTLYGGIALLHSMLPACEVISQYLLTKELEKYLTQRIVTDRYIINKLNILINLFKEFLEVNIRGDYDKYQAIQQAITYTLRAKGLIDVEYSRTQSPVSVSIRIGQIRNAENLLDLAAETLILFPSSTGQDLYKLSKVHEKFGLTTKPPTAKQANSGEIGITKSAWQDYFSNTEQEITDKYSVTNPGSSQDKLLKEALRQELINNLLPLVPGEIRILFLQQAFNKAANGLFDAFPVKATKGVFSGLKSPGDLLTKLNKNILTNVFNTASEGVETYPYAYTLNSSTTNVQYYEAAILLFPNMWGHISSIGGIYSMFLKVTSDRLADILTEMQLVVNNKNSSDSELVLLRNQWSTNLLLIKSNLKPVTTTSSGIPSLSGEAINPNELQNFIETSRDNIKSLRDFINQKTYDGLNPTKKKQDPSVTAYNYAQRTLAPLLLDIGILAAPQTVKKLLSDLQIIKKLLNDGLKADSIELDLTKTYITSIESHPMFPKVKAIFDSALKSLEKSPLSDIYEALSKGRIGDILTVISTTQETVAFVKELMNCLNEDPNVKTDFETSRNILYITEFLKTDTYSNSLTGMPSTEASTKLAKNAEAKSRNLTEDILYLKNSLLITTKIGEQIKNSQASRNNQSVYYNSIASIEEDNLDV